MHFGFQQEVLRFRRSGCRLPTVCRSKRRNSASSSLAVEYCRCHCGPCPFEVGVPIPDRLRRRAAYAPIAAEAANILATGIRPATRNLPTAASPAEAMHPHSLQTGLPPSSHGTTCDAKSADTQAVTCEKDAFAGTSWRTPVASENRIREVHLRKDEPDRY